MTKKINFIISLLFFCNCVSKPPVIVEDPITIDEIHTESNAEIVTKPILIEVNFMELSILFILFIFWVFSVSE